MDALSYGLVSIKNGRSTTTSLVIAETFGRPHRNVVRSIENLIKNGTINTLRVERINYLDSRGREQRGLQLSEREALIAMPFIGGRRSEQGQVILVDAFLNARAEINRLHALHSLPEWQAVRLEVKSVRREEADVIKTFVDYAKSQGSKSAGKYFLGITKETNRALFFVQSAVGEGFRDRLTSAQLSSIAMAERIVERALLEAMGAQMFYRDAYRLSADRVRQFAQFVGKSVPGKSTSLREAA